MLCCSSQCPKYKDCARAVINNHDSTVQVENWYSHGWGILDIDGWHGHSDCGPSGNYALFIPVVIKHEV